MAEIKLRAMKRIGELVRDLDKSTAGRRGKGIVANGGKKSRAIHEAGLSVRTAARYEEIAGPKDERAMKAATTAMELYFATCHTG